MALSRRSRLRSVASAPALALSGPVRAKAQTTPRFIPVIDLVFLDPVYAPAQVTHKLRKEPVERGGSSAAVCNWQGIDWLNPAANTIVRREGKVAGWYFSKKMGALREKGLAESTLAARQQICRDIQVLAFEEIPYYPIGQYKQPTAYRKSIVGILDGTAVFWSVRPS